VPVRLGVAASEAGLAMALARRAQSVGWPPPLAMRPQPLEAVVAMRLDALVLDLDLLGSEPWSYLQEVCKRLPQLGVVIWTRRTNVAQCVRALRLGADDYVSASCTPDELIARVEAVVRRRKQVDGGAEAAPIVVGSLAIRADRYQASLDGAALDLTRREFELLQMLAAAEGQVLRREEIYERVWGYAMARGDRSVDVYVRKLRQKLERASPQRRYIHTHFGIGYRFAVEATATSAVAALDELAPEAAPA
jgi:DNA-binding response OmpR family regulator